MTAKPYEAGKRFGRLEVLQPIGMYKQQWRLYECRCDCGNIIEASSYHLACNKRSCGCMLYESRSNIGKRNAIDISGLRSGLLVAIKVSEQRDRRGRLLWVCKCDCGTEKAISPIRITKQTIASCGCSGYKTMRPESVRLKRIKYSRNRRKIDPKFVLSVRVGNQIRKWLKRGSKARKKWQDIVGYSSEALEERLRSTMPDGYTWDDFLSGELHIDHIVPLSVHNFQTPADTDFIKAWALTNLQLLPASKNIRKRATLSAPFQPSFAWSA